MENRLELAFQHYPDNLGKALFEFTLDLIQQRIEKRQIHLYSGDITQEFNINLTKDQIRQNILEELQEFRTDWSSKLDDYSDKELENATDELLKNDNFDDIQPLGNYSLQLYNLFGSYKIIIKNPTKSYK